MLILSSGPFRTGSTIWQTRSGFVLTVVCKITYWLKPGEAAVAAEQEAVNDADDHWDDDPNRSVRAPNDLMPSKIRPEVMLVGYAYAPNNQAVRSLVARMIVGEVDKSIEVHCDRTFLPDGSLQEGSRFTRMRLNWERAGGGPGTSNPVGVRADARDTYGRRPVPNLQPIGSYVSNVDDFIAPVGFGPIAASWPSRADLLNRAPPAAGEGLEGPSAAYYNAAPGDQQLSVLRENERIVLENLHPEHARLVTSLPGCRPAIFVERTQGKASRVAAQADSLWIDTDRGIATLTWRARIPLARQDEQGRVLVSMEMPGRELTWGEVSRVMSQGQDDDDDAPMETITTTTPLIPSAALPFAARATQTVSTSREAPRASSNADLPFQPARSPSTPPAPATPWASTQLKAPPAPTPSSPGARASLPGTVVAPGAGVPPPPTSTPPPPPPVPQPAAVSPPPPVQQPPPVVQPSVVLQPAPVQPPPPVQPQPVPPPPVRPQAVSFSDAGPASLEKPRAPASPWAGGASPGLMAAQPQTIGAQVVAAAAAQAEAPKDASDANAGGGNDKPWNAPRRELRSLLSADEVGDKAKAFQQPPPFTKSSDAAPAPVVPPKPVRAPGGFDAAFGGGKSGGPAPTANKPAGGFDGAFGGVKAASDAAAARSTAAEAENERVVRREVVTDSQVAARRQAVVTLLHFDAQIMPRVRKNKRFAAALASKSKGRRAAGLDEPMKDARSEDRNDVLRVLSCGQPSDAPEIRRMLADCLDDLDELEPPLLLVAGELRPIFDEVEVLRTTVAVAQQVASGDKKVLAAIAVGQEALSASITPRPETTMGFVKQIETAAGSLSLPTRYVQAEVERVLTEGRKYKRRTLLGAPRVRADLVLMRSGETFPMYVPDAASTSMPLLPTFPVIALCDVIPREDLTESQDEALMAHAVGRVLRMRGNS